MSYDINIYFRNSKNGKIINPYGDNFSYTSENQDIQEKQYKRNLKVAKILEKEYSDFFHIGEYLNDFQVQLEVKNWENIGITPQFYGDLLIFYIHFSGLSISDEDHARYISDIVWKVSQEEDCIIDDPQLGMFGIPSKIFLEVKNEFDSNEIYKYKTKEDYINRIIENPKKDFKNFSIVFIIIAIIFIITLIIIKFNDLNK